MGVNSDTLNLIERTNKMQPCSRIYYLQCFLIAQHVSDDTPPIIRSLKTVIAASGFTNVYGCRSLRWLNHRSIAFELDRCITASCDLVCVGTRR
jgi:hypothetical protein